MPLSGVVVETAAPVNASGAPPARALERLQPPAAPPLVPNDSRPGSGNPPPPPAPIRPNDSRAAPHPANSTATAGTPEPNRPPAALPSLLRNLFRTD
jgi:hypothetical protein